MQNKLMSQGQNSQESTSSSELLKIMAAVESRVKHSYLVSLENTSRENVRAGVSLYNYIGTLSMPNSARSAR